MKRAVVLALAILCSYFAISASAAARTPGEVLASFPLGGIAPAGLAWDGTALWVADSSTATLRRIDPETGKELSSLEAPGFRPAGLAWDGARLWCLDAADRTAYALDPATGKTVAALPLDTDSPEGLGWDGRDLWVADARAGVVARIDKRDGTTYRSFPAPGGSRKGQILGVAFDGKSLWMADRTADRIYQVDPATGWVLCFFASPGPYPAGLAWDGKSLWCADYETRRLERVATTTSAAYVTYDPRHSRIVFQERWRNFGPGTVETLDVYLALPQDLPSQTLAGEPTFDPAPADYPKDQWGQKFAHFRFKEIPPGGDVSAAMTVEATVKRVRWFVDPAAVGPLSEVPADIKKAYLADGPKLQLDSPVIRGAVKEALGGETNPYWMAQKINRYIQDRMRYEMVGGWNTAPVVLARGTGSCSEYTFVMVSMCRAAELPARYAGSVVVRGDDASRDDVFHRWVEVYLPNYGWVPVDPSGGDSPSPEEQSKYFGGLDNRFLITTLGGGDSTYLGWNYNSEATWTARGRVKVMQEKAGEWVPVGKKYEATPAGEAGGLGCKPGLGD